MTSTDFASAALINSMVNQGKLMKTVTEEEQEAIKKTLDKFRYHAKEEKQDDNNS